MDDFLFFRFDFSPALPEPTPAPQPSDSDDAPKVVDPNDPLESFVEGRWFKHFCKEICKYRRLDGFNLSFTEPFTIHEAGRLAMTAVRSLDADKVLVGHGRHQRCQFVDENTVTTVSVSPERKLQVSVELRPVESK